MTHRSHSTFHSVSNSPYGYIFLFIVAAVLPWNAVVPFTFDLWTDEKHHETRWVGNSRVCLHRCLSREPIVLGCPGRILKSRPQSGQKLWTFSGCAPLTANQTTAGQSLGRLISPNITYQNLNLHARRHWPETSIVLTLTSRKTMLLKFDADWVSGAWSPSSLFHKARLVYQYWLLVVTVVQLNTSRTSTWDT
jgi:hypothetical protein